MLKKFAVAMVAAGGLMVAAAPAHAGGHVSIGLGIGLPVGGYVAPAPVYYGPPAPPVVYEAAPYYGPYPYYGAYYGPRYYGYGPRVVYRAGWHGGYYGHAGWHR
jgi:hypothetical protein